MRALIAILAVAALALVATFASAGRLGPIALRPVPTPTPRVYDWPPAAPTDAPMATHPRLLSGFVVPVGGMDVPTEEQFLPNSPRAYRAGYHEGIDFPVKAGTPVLAAKAGTIVRIDRDFIEWTPAQEQAAFDAAMLGGHTPVATLDHLRGRQIWIDHGNGIVTRYAHLQSTAPLREGDSVTQGQLIGAAGSSGYTEGGPHLHFEIRVDDDFYGDGLPLAELRYVVSAAFR